MTVQDALGHTDWALLAAQKLALIKAIRIIDEYEPNKHMDLYLEGLLAWVDAIQDAAEKEGHPVVWLEERN